MKKGLLIVSLLCLIILPFTSQADPGEVKEKKKKWTLIKIRRINDDAAWLDFQNGGYGLLTMFPTKVIGVRSVENDGFRFTPAKSAPEGMMSQKLFDRFYKLNTLVNEVFIPYSEMKSVKFWKGVTIRTKDGKKYHFICKKPKQIVRQIRSQIPAN